jgi:hypothetical protein
MNDRLILTLVLAVLLGCFLALADDGLPSRGAPDFSVAAAQCLEPKSLAGLPGRLPVFRRPRTSAAAAQGAPAPAFTPLRC